jgi:hypothetical protein
MTDKQSDWLKLLVLGVVLAALFKVIPMWEHGAEPPKNVPANDFD